MNDNARELFISTCTAALSTHRNQALAEILRLKNMLSGEISGDDADISQVLETQSKALQQKDKLEAQIHEIDAALLRINDGSYGICQETGEEIEDRRLRALPWTRYSSEGAEIVERRNRRYAKERTSNAFDGEQEEMAEEE